MLLNLVSVNSERLANMRQYLADELKSDNPSMKYVEDLQGCIKDYEKSGVK